MNKCSSSLRFTTGSPTNATSPPSMSAAATPLAIDELGYVHLDQHSVELLFQILPEREERAAIAVASNVPFSEWSKPSPAHASPLPSSTASPTEPTSSKPAPTATDSTTNNVPARWCELAPSPWDKIKPSNSNVVVGASRQCVSHGNQQMILRLKIRRAKEHENWT